MIRRLWLLLMLLAVLGVVAGLAVHLASLHLALQRQLLAADHDRAQALAALLQRTLPERRAALLRVEFDGGTYRLLRLQQPGDESLELSAHRMPREAPPWLDDWWPLGTQPAQAELEGGGRLQVQGHVAAAYDALWNSGIEAGLWMLALGLLAALPATLAMWRLRRPLRAIAAQADSLSEGRYVLVSEPAPADLPELRQVARAMNAMVLKVRGLFETQAAQAEALRQQAHCDALTGLPHRAHFTGRLAALLQREKEAVGGAMVLVRLARLEALNRQLGRDSVDRALRTVAQVLQGQAQEVGDAFAGRLNGSDFALCLPSGSAAAAAQATGAALLAALGTLGPSFEAQVGAVALRREAGLGELLAQADFALAGAESHGGFSVEVAADGVPGGAGEQAWGSQLLAALEQGRTRLAEYPVVDREERLLLRECPLRVQLRRDGSFEPASRWLPLARRHDLGQRVDAAALAHALEALASDGIPRGVHVGTASLLDAGFVPRLRRQLQQRPQMAHKLWLEFGEGAALEQFDRLAELVRALRPLGVRVGLEHAGQRLHRIARLAELGLDFVKLDAALCADLAGSAPAREFVRAAVALLHGLSLQVHAEGVAGDADAQALWECGVDAVAGPWATARATAPGVS